MWNLRELGPKRRADLGEPQKTVDQILGERSRQASQHLVTPLGRLFTEKKWTEFKKIYQPQTDFHEFAQMIRALYIQNQISSFNSEDIDHLLKLTYDTLERISVGNRNQAGLLITQFFRLPLPEKQSSTYQQLESWLGLTSKEGTFLNRLATIKLVTQDLHPSERAIHAFISGYQTPLDNMNRTEWIRLTDDIRSSGTRERCLKELFKIYPQLHGMDQSQALITLGHQPELNPKSISKYAIQSLDSEEAGSFEAGLRTVASLIQANLLNPDQKALIAKRLTHVPEKLKTPYVDAKIDDLLPRLTAHP